MNLVLVSLPSILIVMSTADLSHLARALILDPVTAGYEPVAGRAVGGKSWRDPLANWCLWMERRMRFDFSNINEPSRGTVCWRSCFARRGSLLASMAERRWQTVYTKEFLTSEGRTNSKTIVRGGM